MRIYMSKMRSRIKRVTSEYNSQSRIVWPSEETRILYVEDHNLLSRQCSGLLKAELQMRWWLEFILVCRMCEAPFELLEVTALLSHGHQRSMRRLTKNLGFTYKEGDAWIRQSVEKCLVAGRDKLVVFRC